MRKFTVLVLLILLPFLTFSQSAKAKQDANGNVITTFKDKTGKIVGKSKTTKKPNDITETVHYDRSGKIIGRETKQKNGTILIKGTVSHY